MITINQQIKDIKEFLECSGITLAQLKHTLCYVEEFRSNDDWAFLEKAILKMEEQGLLPVTATSDSDDFLKNLKEGGTIVNSSECSDLEIATAKAFGRFFIDKDGNGYVICHARRWQTSQEDACQHPKQCACDRKH